MKNFLFLCLSLIAFTVNGQNADSKSKKTEHLEVRTSSVCDMCERTIEDNLIYEKGVKKVELDLATGLLHIEYDPKKNTPEGLRTALTKLGYAADDVPGDPEAFAKLPACCQKEGCGKLPEQKP
jgi:periplasmic mercuric ion binding protein